MHDRYQPGALWVNNIRVTLSPNTHRSSRRLSHP